MNKDRILEQIRAYVKAGLEGEGSGHDWWHVVRVCNNALDIGRQTEGTDLFVVELGALLHDIADHKFGYSDEDRSRIISGLLKEYGASEEVIEHVIYIANHISFKGGTNKHKLTTLEARIVQDADRLDAIGAIGIGRAFAYGGHVGRPMFDPAEGSAGKESVRSAGLGSGDTVSHFYEKLLLLKDLMNTEIGAQKAQRRHEAMEQFLDQFYAEWNGGI